MKKIGTLALTLALSASLALPALAAEDGDLLISPAPGGEETAQEVTFPGPVYNDVLVVNGEVLDTSAIPDVDGIPMRLLVESDHGSAYWDPDTSEGTGYFEGAYVSVNVATFAIKVNDEAVEGVTAAVKYGVSFLPAEVIDGLEGYDVTVTENEDGTKRYEVTTPNNDPMIKLAYAILDASGCGASMKSDVDTYAMNYSLPEGTFADGVWFMGFNISPDTLMVAKLAEDADRDAVMEALEANKQSLVDTFSWYLSHNLPKAEDARMVIEGDYVLFLVADNAEAGEQVFRDFVASRKTIDVVVTGKDGSSTTLSCETGEEFLGSVLLDSGIVEGEMGEYGLFITTVNGYTADSDAQEWWCITKGGEEVMTGADTTPIADGDQFELTLKTGW